MAAEERSRIRLRAALTLTAALVVGGSLVASGAPAAKEEPESPPKLMANAVLHPTGTAGLMEDEGIFYARQRGQRMGIIAVLIGLKPDQDYVLRFSRARCGEGRGGLGRLRRRIEFTSGAEGQAHVENGNLSRGLLRRARSVVVLTEETGNRFQGCGGVVLGWELKNPIVTS